MLSEVYKSSNSKHSVYFDFIVIVHTYSCSSEIIPNQTTNTVPIKLNVCELLFIALSYELNN